MALLRRGRDWLDARGKTGWIIATLLAFIIAWPVGLALLAYMIWSNRMFSSLKRPTPMSLHSSGNTAFDAYRADTLRRLQEEQDNFEAFLGRLRDAKDKAEFERFMEERARAPKADDATA
ncbi:MAG: DUF2852 domain-containing protein [Roseovarius sp.]